jgi:hypothetical protein
MSSGIGTHRGVAQPMRKQPMSHIVIDEFLQQPQTSLGVIVRSKQMNKFLSALTIACGFIISTALAQQTESPQHLYDIKPGMKAESVMAGLRISHVVTRDDSEVLGITAWTVVGKDRFANNPVESGQVLVKDGSVLDVTLWLTEGYSGEAVKLSQGLFETLYSHLVPSKTDTSASPPRPREATVKLAVLQLNPILDEQRISITFDDGAWFSIVIGKYGDVPRFVHVERGCTIAGGTKCDLTPNLPLQTPPIAVMAVTTPRTERPRVAIESWETEEGAGIFAPRPPKQNAQASDETPVFIQRCPQVAAVLERREGDYVLRFDHHYGQGSYSYNYTLFDNSGASLGSGSNLALWAAVDAACRGILGDSNSKVR